MRTFILKTAFVVGALMMIFSPPLQAAEKLKMSVIAPGTSPYLIMTTMATIVNQGQDKVDIKVDATGAATKHMIELAQGKIDMCMNSPVVYGFMKNQKAMYKKMKNAPELAKNLRLLFWFTYGQYHVVTYADDNIRTFEDVRGKRVFLGPPGGGAWAAAAQWFEAASGLKAKKDFKNVKASWSSAFQGFQDRQFDVLVTGGIAPYPQIEQLSLTSKLYILGLTKKEFDSNKKAYAVTHKPGREVGIIPVGIYGKNVLNKEDVYTLGSVVGVSVNKSMNDDTVHLITKSFWEGAKKAVKTHPWLKNVTMEYGVHDAGMKLHPGAMKYYKEMGVGIPAASMP
jgi:uncharacterized protein